MFRSLGQVKASDAACPSCEGVTCDVQTFFKITGSESFLDRTPAQIGLPAFDILIARGRERTVGLELSGDAAEVLGELWSGEEALEWA